MSSSRKSLLLFSCILSLSVSAQSIQRQSIGSLGTVSSQDGLYLQECMGQPYQTQGSASVFMAGFIQPLTYDFASTVKLNVKLYPVPVHDQLHLEWDLFKGETHLRVYNVMGVMLKQKTQPSGASGQMDCSDLAVGVYVIEVQQNKNIQRTTIIKQ